MVSLAFLWLINPSPLHCSLLMSRSSDGGFACCFSSCYWITAISSRVCCSSSSHYQILRKKSNIKQDYMPFSSGIPTGISHFQCRDCHSQMWFPAIHWASNILSCTNLFSPLKPMKISSTHKVLWWEILQWTTQFNNHFFLLILNLFFVALFDGPHFSYWKKQQEIILYPTPTFHIWLYRPYRPCWHSHLVIFFFSFLFLDKDI